MNNLNCNTVVLTDFETILFDFEMIHVGIYRLLRFNYNSMSISVFVVVHS